MLHKNNAMLHGAGKKNEDLHDGMLCAWIWWRILVGEEQGNIFLGKGKQSNAM